MELRKNYMNDQANGGPGSEGFNFLTDLNWSLIVDNICVAGGFPPTPITFDNGGPRDLYAERNNTANGTMIIEGNWDSVTNGQDWTITPESIPESLFLGGKPTWFGNLNWPPINPANPVTNDPTIIPAGYRYVHGNDPPAGPLAAPQITSHPSDLTVAIGRSATFIVGANGNPSPQFQWKRNGQVIPGATARVYSTHPLSSLNDGDLYSCFVSNNRGSVESSQAQVALIEAPILISQGGEKEEEGFGRFSNVLNLTKEDKLIIQLNLSHRREVAVTIHTRKGEKVEVLRNNGLPYVEWNVDKKNLASGLYILTLEIGNEVRTRKVVVIK